jgi:hypothetical protein
VASGRSLDLPSVCSAEFGPVRSWPEATQIRKHQCRLRLGCTPLWGVSHVPPNLNVLLIIWSSSNRSCDKLGAMATPVHTDSWKGSLFHGLSRHLGRNLGAKEKWGANTLPYPHWVAPTAKEQEVPGRINNYVTLLT